MRTAAVRAANDLAKHLVVLLNRCLLRKGMKFPLKQTVVQPQRNTTPALVSYASPPPTDATPCQTSTKWGPKSTPPPQGICPLPLTHCSSTGSDALAFVAKHPVTSLPLKKAQRSVRADGVSGAARSLVARTLPLLVPPSPVKSQVKMLPPEKISPPPLTCHPPQMSPPFWLVTPPSPRYTAAKYLGLWGQSLVVISIPTTIHHKACPIISTTGDAIRSSATSGHHKDQPLSIYWTLFQQKYLHLPFSGSHGDESSVPSCSNFSLILFEICGSERDVTRAS